MISAPEVPRTAAHGLRLTVGGREADPGPLRWVRAVFDAFAPAFLHITEGALRIAEGITGAAEGPPARIGDTVVLSLTGEERFRGRIDRISFAAGGSTTIAAREAWAGRALRLPRDEEYRESTDAEVAARIADALGLAARIDSTEEVHRALVRRGDPIEFLGQRARASGRRFGLAEGTLHFARALPVDRPVRELEPGARVFAFESIEWRGGSGGSIAVDGFPEIFPLDFLKLFPRLHGRAAEDSVARRISRVDWTWDGRRMATRLSWIREESWAAREEGRVTE